MPNKSRLGDNVVQAFNWPATSQYRLATIDPACSTSLTGYNANLAWFRGNGTAVVIGARSGSAGYSLNPTTSTLWRMESISPSVTVDASGGTVQGAWAAVGGHIDYVSGALRSCANLTVLDSLVASPLIAVNPIFGYMGKLNTLATSQIGYFHAPLLLSRALTLSDIAAYFNDRGRRQAAIFSDASLVSAIRWDARVPPGTAIKTYALNSDGTVATDCTVRGPVTRTRGAAGGFGRWAANSNTISRVQVPWIDSAAVAGKTVLLSVTFDSLTPSLVQHILGRVSAGTGGIRIFMNATTGLIRADYYDSTGTGRFAQTFASAPALTATKYWLSCKVPAGTGVTGRFQQFDNAGGLVQEKTATISTAAVAYNGDGQLCFAASASATQMFSQGLISDYYEIPVVLTDGEVAQVILGTYAGTISRHLTGADTMWNDGGTYRQSVIDDAAPTRLWGVYAADIVYSPAAVQAQPIMLIPGA